MPRRQTPFLPSTLLILLCPLLAPLPALAGGAWLPAPGDGEFAVGYSRKTAHTSWDDSGDGFVNTGRFENHDFRYTYLSGEFGLSERWAAHFLITHLDGREGPTGELERNSGLSDAWFGVKYALTTGELRTALDLTLRTAEFYDIDGPYSRDLFDDDGEFLGHSPEWRGLLKEDLTLEWQVGRSLRQGRQWFGGSIGYTYRTGAPADQIPLSLEGGWWHPSRKVAGKLAVLAVRSLGNDSERREGDRFGSRPGFNFNDASMARLGGSILVPLGSSTSWTVEAGYNVWLWGRSARQYEEPFFAVSRRF